MKATQCSVDGCDDSIQALGLCVKHRGRLMRTGTTDEPSPRVTLESVTKRFWSKVDRRADDECWPWLGTMNGQGYGQFYRFGRRTGAHRAAYELLIGPIPEGLEIDHVKARGCERLDCVNPAHLEAVPHWINNVRSNSPSAINAKKSRCPSGHEYVTQPSGTRFCPICKRAAARRRGLRSLRW